MTLGYEPLAQTPVMCVKSSIRTRMRGIIAAGKEKDPAAKPSVISFPCFENHSISCLTLAQTTINWGESGLPTARQRKG